MLRKLKNHLNSEFDIDGLYRLVYPEARRFLLSIWKIFEILAYEWNFLLFIVFVN